MSLYILYYYRVEYVDFIWKEETKPEVQLSDVNSTFTSNIRVSALLAYSQQQTEMNPNDQKTENISITEIHFFMPVLD